MQEDAKKQEQFRFVTRAERRTMARKGMKARKKRIGDEQRAQGAVKFNRLVLCERK